MTGRRKFIKKSAISISGGVFLNYNGYSLNPYHTQNLPEEDDPNFWAEVRKKFPLSDSRTYFNNGTIGPSPFVVTEAVKESIDDLARRGEYNGQEASRAPLAKFLGVKESEISLTHNTTEGINIVAAGLHLEKGDEIIMTTHEHAGNALPWLNQMKQRGAIIKPFQPGNTRSENLNRINDLISPRTKVIAVPHITCTTGHKLPAKEVCDLAREKSIISFLDGAHGPGTLNLDLNAIGCDFYASCGHKWMLAPSGTGFLFVRESSRDSLKPMAIGAYSDTGWEISKDSQRLDGYVQTAHRFDYGTQSGPLSNGFKAAINFLDTIGKEKIESYIKDLSNHLYDGLQGIGDPLDILSASEPESRGTMISFRIRNKDFRDFGKFASSNKFRIRLVPESGLDAIRISTHIYNNESEIDRFIETVKSYIS